MSSEHFQNSVQLLANALKRYIPTSSLKIGKAIYPVCDVKNSNRAFRWQVANGQPWGSLLLKIKIERKQKLDTLLF